MRARAALLAGGLALGIAAAGVPAETDASKTVDELASDVAKMVRIGRSFSPTFSPDGKRIAFVSDLSGIPQVWTVPAEGGWPSQVTSGDDPVTRVAWSPNADWLAFSLAPGGGMNTQIYVVHPDGTGLRRLTDGGKENNWLGDWVETGEYLTMSSNRRTPAAMDDYLAAPAAGTLELLARNEGIGSVANLSRDERRAVLYRMQSRSDSNLYLLDRRDGKETLLTQHEGPGNFAGMISPDGRTVWLQSDKGRDLAAFARIRIDPDGRPGPIEIVAARSEGQLDDFEIDRQGTTAALLWNIAGRHELAFVALGSGRSTPGPALPAELAGGLAFSRDGRFLALTSSGATSPPDVWVLDVKKRRFRQVTHSPHAGIDLGQLVRPELVRFKAHDGEPLSGWLYRPKTTRGPAPYVVSFHGGPEGQERPAFRSDYQALLSQAIGVFAPNVRGSSGFGKRFVNLDNGALRFDAIRDIKSCVDLLVASGTADPKRIGITGGSYGGYMTMAGLTEYPDLFAAGVDLFGIVNFATFFQHTEPWMAAISTIEYGDPNTQSDLLSRLSPLQKLGSIRAPTMVQHGANDTNVPVIEAEQIVDDLKARGVPVEYVLFTDEGHGFRKTANRVRSTVSLVQFFVRHLGEVPIAQSRK